MYLLLKHFLDTKYNFLKNCEIVIEYVEVAKDSLDVDEPYVMQQLINTLPAEYEVPAK